MMAGQLLNSIKLSCLSLFAVSISVGAYAQSSGETQVPQNPLKDAYFGDTHMHTGVSMDAFIAGNRLTPDDAYRLGKGEEIMVNGSLHKIKCPLDFVAVTDHSEFIGEA
jgi:hypothetical protein